MRINQKQIAKELNISPATVSLVLSDPETSRASKETKNRIFAMVSSMPQTSSKTDTLLMLINDDTLRFYFGNSLLSGAQSRAAEIGLKFEIINPNQDLSPIFATRRIRGLLVSSWRLLLPKEIQKLPLPPRVITLNVERRAPFKGIAVMSDHFEGIQKAIALLIEGGHKKITFLGYEIKEEDGYFSRTKERVVIFNEALESLGIDPEKHLVHLIPDTKMESIDRTEEIRSFIKNYIQKKKTTAVIAFNDLLASKVMSIAQREGIKVPEELSIVGIDNEPFCENIAPSLSSISPEFSRMGRVAVNLISDDSIWAGDDRPARVVIPSKLFKRESLAPLS